MEKITIDIAGLEVVERIFHRLRDLFRKRRIRIVRQPMVLAIARGELGLDKEAGAGHHAFGDCDGEGFAYGGFEIVFPLIRGVDGAKTRFDREVSQPGGLGFLPGGSVDEGGQTQTLPNGPCDRGLLIVGLILVGRFVQMVVVGENARRCDCEQK